MTGLRYSPLHVTEFCGEMQGKFIVGLARLMIPEKASFTRKNVIRKTLYSRACSRAFSQLKAITKI